MDTPGAEHGQTPDPGHRQAAAALEQAGREATWPALICTLVVLLLEPLWLLGVCCAGIAVMVVSFNQASIPMMVFVAGECVLSLLFLPLLVPRIRAWATVFNSRRARGRAATTSRPRATPPSFSHEAIFMDGTNPLAHEDSAQPLPHTRGNSGNSDNGEDGETPSFFTPPVFPATAQEQQEQQQQQQQQQRLQGDSSMGSHVAPGAGPALAIEVEASSHSTNLSVLGHSTSSGATGQTAVPGEAQLGENEPSHAGANGDAPRHTGANGDAPPSGSGRTWRPFHSLHLWLSRRNPRLMELYRSTLWQICVVWVLFGAGVLLLDGRNGTPIYVFCVIVVVLRGVSYGRPDLPPYIVASFILLPFVPCLLIFFRSPPSGAPPATITNLPSFTFRLRTVGAPQKGTGEEGAPQKGTGGGGGEGASQKGTGGGERGSQRRIGGGEGGSWQGTGRERGAGESGRRLQGAGTAGVEGSSGVVQEKNRNVASKEEEEENEDKTEPWVTPNLSPIMPTGGSASDAEGAPVVHRHQRQQQGEAAAAQSDVLTIEEGPSESEGAGGILVGGREMGRIEMGGTEMGRMEEGRIEMGGMEEGGVGSSPGASKRWAEDQVGVLWEGTDRETTVSWNDAECAICLGRYGDGEQLRELPCLHHFHLSCVDEWLTRKSICPLCKRDIKGPTEALLPPEADFMINATTRRGNAPAIASTGGRTGASSGGSLGASTSGAGTSRTSRASLPSGVSGVSGHSGVSGVSGVSGSSGSRGRSIQGVEAGGGAESSREVSSRSSNRGTGTGAHMGQQESRRGRENERRGQSEGGAPSSAWFRLWGRSQVPPAPREATAAPTRGMPPGPSRGIPPAPSRGMLPAPSPSAV